MNKKKIKYLVISIIVVLILFFVANNYGLFRFDSFVQLRKCQSEEKLRKENISGQIIAKYRDADNHNAKTLEIQSNGKIWRTSFLILDVSGAFEQLRIGDYIRKEVGSTNLAVERNDSIINLILDFDCSK